MMSENPATDMQLATNRPEPIAVGEKGLRVGNLDEMWRLCTITAKSGLAPKSLDTPEKLFVAAQHGAEVGLSFMQSIQGIAVINGKPSLYGDAFMAVIRSHPQWDDDSFEEWYEGEEGKPGWTAFCKMGRVGKAPQVREFSLEDAKKAGLLDKPGPWKQYPKRMLMMRARGFCGRDTFADSLKGMIIHEEAQDYKHVDVDVRPIKKVQPKKKAAAAKPAQTPEPSTDATPPPASGIDREALISDALSLYKQLDGKQALVFQKNFKLEVCTAESLSEFSDSDLVDFVGELRKEVNDRTA
jgi:hypothetical protein